MAYYCKSGLTEKQILKSLLTMKKKVRFCLDTKKKETHRFPKGKITGIVFGVERTQYQDWIKVRIMTKKWKCSLAYNPNTLEMQLNIYTGNNRSVWTCGTMLEPLKRVV